MSPLPWDERWLPVALPVLAVVAAALGVRALLRRLAPADPRAAAAAALGTAAFGVVAGHDALGPDLAQAHRALGWALGAALALVGAGLVLRRVDEPAGGGVATLVLGLALGLAPAMGWLAAERALAFDSSVRAVSESRAQWRRRLAPNDPEPWLALALVARSREQNDHAWALAAVAEGLAGGDDRFRAELLELRADVLATRGECEEARALFDDALAARARAAMESLDLDLSQSYRLPRALAAHCGWSPH